MPDLIALLQTYGVLIVFAIVLVEQAGMPIPAFPILVVAGALSVDGGVSWPAAIAVAVGACLLTDLFWFRAGRFYGKRILNLLRGPAGQRSAHLIRQVGAPIRRQHRRNVEPRLAHLVQLLIDSLAPELLEAPSVVGEDDPVTVRGGVTITRANEGLECRERSGAHLLADSVEVVKNDHEFPALLTQCSIKHAAEYILELD